MTPQKKSPNWLNNVTGSRLAIFFAIGIVGYLVWTEHQAHILAALPYLIILLCPLMHIFMHRGHGGKHGEH